MAIPALPQQVAVVAVAVVSLALLWLAGARGVVARLRTRLILGVPWGTLLTVLFVLGVYLFLQGGIDRWHDPLVMPFRAWSYLYPLGVLTAGFSHAGPGHMLGNLFGTLALAPIAEYAVGHFPRERGSSTFSSWRTNPYIRVLLVPATAIVVGVVLTAFTLGPVIGFSGIVFAFGGFALVFWPIRTVVALTAARLLRLGYQALTSPTITASGRPSYVTPWWADIAIQGHAVGLLVGILLGVAVARGRSTDTPSVGRLWVGVLLFAVAQALWAVYWYRGGETYVLYRAIGLALVVGLATIVALAVAGSDDPLLPRLAAVTGDPTESFLAALRSVSVRQVGVVALVLGAAVVAGPAIPVNLTTTSGDSLPGDPVEVRGYEVSYAEDVPNGMVAVVDVEAFGETTAVNTSGVIVRNEDRHLWTTAVTKGRLAFAGRATVRLGGIGWTETISVRRQGWSAANGPTAYYVALGVGDEEPKPVFASDPARAEPVVADRNVSVAVDGDAFELVVEHGNESVRAPLPAANESVTLANVTFVREGPHVYAEHNGTRVRIASKERYREVDG